MDRPLEQYLRGRWTLERAVADYHGGLEGRMTGVCAFEAGLRPRVLMQRESGKLAFGPFAHEAARAYEWRFKDPARAAVFFTDGRFFHNVLIMNNAATARHECGADLYEAAYAFEAEDRWRARWRVRGPRKDYLLDTVYTRR